ncbi:MAG: transposase [Bdellovibrionales bacterium]|nr:transposase [Bdellovibrionales bacterium]
MPSPRRRRSSQLQLFRGSLARRAAVKPVHGGETSLGRRKTRRPLDPRRPIHVTLRAERARGRLSLLAPRVRFTVKRLTLRAAERHGVQVRRFVNVGNHLHILVKAPTREAIQNFLRQTAGHVAQAVTGARKGAPAPSTVLLNAANCRRRFWDALAYTRVVKTPREEVGLQKYFLKNLAEALGLPDPRARFRGDTVELKIPRGAGPPLEEVWG